MMAYISPHRHSNHAVSKLRKVMSKQATEFTIANITGGNLRAFHLVAGELPKAALRHARNIGYGGPSFDGPAAREAYVLFEAAEESRLDGDD
jgi:hypothetical protein